MRNNNRFHRSSNSFWLITGILMTIVIVASVVVWYFSSRQSLSEGEQALVEYRKSIPKLQTQLEQDPDNLRLNSEYAYSLYVTQSDEAIAAYEKLTGLNPENDRALINLGNLYRKSKQFEPAIAAYTQASEVNKTNLNAYINLSHMYYYDLRQTDESFEVLQQGIENNPEEITLYLVLAKLYERQDGEAEAEELYDKIREIDPDYPIEN